MLTLGKLKVAWGSNGKLTGVFGAAALVLNGARAAWHWGVRLLACGVGTAGGPGCGFGNDSARRGQGRGA